MKKKHKFQNPILITYEGRTESMHSWSKIKGIPLSVLSRRYKKYAVGEITLDDMLDASKKSPEILEYNGISDTISGWSKRLMLNRDAMIKRLYEYRQGRLSKDKLFSPSMEMSLLVTYHGITKSRTEWAKELGISKTAFRHRLMRLRAGEISEDYAFHAGRHLHKQNEYEFEGKIYTTEGIARKLGISRTQFLGRVAAIKRGSMSEKSLYTKGTIGYGSRNIDKLKRYEYKGKKVSLNDLERIGEVRHVAIARRLRKGWTLESAVNTSIEESRKLARETNRRNRKRRELMKMGFII